MLKNYFVITLRNLSRNKVFSLINIAGLGIGLACCLLIILYTRDELSFDRFQKNSKDLYRITCRIVDKVHGRDDKYGISAMVEGPAFKAAIPEIRSYVRTMGADFVCRKGTETFNQKATYVDDEFFGVFSFPLLAGNSRTALADPHSVVLTDEMAKKYFGTTDAIGKTLEFEIDGKFEIFTVSAIARRSPENSSIGFDILLPFKYIENKSPDDRNNWLWLSYSTFVLVQPGSDINKVTAKMQKVYETQSVKQRTEAVKAGMTDEFIWGLQPFLQMHLDDSYHSNGIRASSKPIYSYILNGIAFFILIIASINFINLTVAQSIRRSKEIGLRKVVGSSRAQLIRQFLGESFILCFIAFLLALLLVSISLPLFNDLANKRLSISYLLDVPLVASFIGLFLFTGLGAGFYPALVLSGFNPVDTLYQRIKLSSKNYLSKGLVVLQFALATFLIITTFFLYAQYNYLTHADLGYNDKNLVAVSISDGNLSLNQRMQSEFAKLPGVRQVGRKRNGEWVTISKASGKDIDVHFENIDDQYIPTMRITLKAGRNFSTAFPTDSTNAIIINEAYAKKAGWDHPIGKTVDFLNGNDTKLVVIGVVKDYHYASVKEKIEPQLFTSSVRDRTGRFLIRLDEAKRAATLAAIGDIYRKEFPWHPFEHYFVDEENKKEYESEARWSHIISSAAVVTIFISCIGLFGLSLLSIRQRTKEIGVRKVLGAEIWQIAVLVSRSFIFLVLIAFTVAIPAAWYAVSRWLENFPYRITINPAVFIAAIGLTLMIALFTIGVQALRAGRANPVKSLRTE